MKVPEAMALLADEAERQGIVCGQIQGGTWMIGVRGDIAFLRVTDESSLLEAFRQLVRAGLDLERWSPMDRPNQYER